MEEEEIPARKFQDIRITVPWGYITGRWYGNRQMRPILAIHGWLDNLGTWNTLIPLLPPHIGILCIDLPGHGRSSKYPKGVLYHSLDFVHIIKRVMQEYNWKKVSLMAHSLGAMTVFIYTALCPRTVDMVIAIDVVRHRQYPILERLPLYIEKTLIEDERVEKMALQEPPSYSYEELQRVMYEGSSKSVDLEMSKHLLNRQITKSTKYPDKYYFSRDGKMKFYFEFYGQNELMEELAKRIRNVPYLVIKGSRSNYINSDSTTVLEILRKNNPHFEFHTIEGTHHVHLNNAEAVASVLYPFINRHRPRLMDAWAIDDEALERGKKKARQGIKGKSKKPRSKL